MRNKLDLIEILRKFPWLAINVRVLDETWVNVEANFLRLLFCYTDVGLKLLALDIGVVWSLHYFLHCEWGSVVFHFTVFKAYRRWTERIVPLFINLIYYQVASS